MTEAPGAAASIVQTIWKAAGLRALQGFVILLPFIYDPSAIEPADSARMLFLQIGLCPALFVCLLQLNRRAILQPALWGQLGFLIFAGLSISWAEDGGEAWAEWLELITFAQVFVVGMCLPRNWLRPLLWAVAVSAGLISLLGVVQTFHYEVYPYYQIFPPSATFLNKNVAAQFLGAVSPPTALLMLTERDQVRGRFLAVVLGTVLFYLIMTGSRTAWLTMLITALVFPVWGLLNPHFRVVLPNLMTRESLIRTGICIVLILAMLPGKSHRGTGSRIALEQEMASLIHMDTAAQGQINTVAVRIATNLNSLMMLVDRPIRGVGLGNFRLFFPNYHDRIRPTPTYEVHVIPAKLHNDILQYFVELGLVGGGLFVFFILASFHAAQKSLSRLCGNDYWLLLGVSLACFCLLVISVGSFPLKMSVSSFYFYLWCGVLAGSGLDKLKTHRSALFWAVPGLCLCLWQVGHYGAELRAGREVVKAMIYEYHNDYPNALAAYEKARKLAPHDWYHHDRMATLIANHEPDLAVALAAAQDFSRRDPYNPNGHFRLALLYAKMEQPKLALNQVERVQELAPPTAGLLYLKGELLLQALRPLDAIASFEAVLLLDPDHKNAKAALARMQ